MLEKFYLRYKDKIIGTFLVRDDDVRYRPVHDVARSIPEGLGYPLGMFPLDVQAAGITPVMDYNPSVDDIEFWLSERVFPPEREGAEILLKNLGLESYNVWEVAKRTNAATSHDFYWMSENPNDKYNDMHPRGMMEKSSLNQKKTINQIRKNTEAHWSAKQEITFSNLFLSTPTRCKS